MESFHSYKICAPTSNFFMEMAANQIQFPNAYIKRLDFDFDTPFEFG
jgi:hypothetical protein